MKTKSLFLACLLIASFATTFKSMAQQPKYARPDTPLSHTLPDYSRLNRFYFRLYSAPHGGYGYDIFKNQKLVFHQFVLTLIDGYGKRLFATKQQTQKAAVLAIEKMKNGLPPSITAIELRGIAAE